METVNYLDSCLLDLLHPCSIIIRAVRGGMLLTPVLFLTPGASSSSLLSALCQPVYSCPGVCVCVCGEMLVGGEDEERRGGTGASLGMLTRSVYICSSLSLQPSTRKQRRQSFLGCKAVVGKAWLDTLILLSFGRA